MSLRKHNLIVQHKKDSNVQTKQLPSQSWFDYNIFSMNVNKLDFEWKQITSLASSLQFLKLPLVAATD